MKRFRINANDNVRVNVTHNGKLILPTLSDHFSSINEIKAFVKNRLNWEYKGLGRRIEISIHNLDKGQSKYINTFS